jgi:uncharacterized protein (DUF433 family)
MKMAKRIVVDPQVMHGKPVIAGTRIPVYMVLELLAGGLSPVQVLEEYPDLTAEDVQACLVYTARLAEEEIGVL